jgi:hypothetical protein
MRRIGWALVLGCGQAEAPCVVEDLARELAGAGAVACGRAAPEEGAAVEACMVEAFEAGDPFWGLVDTRGKDSLIVRGVVRVEGEHWQVMADFYGCGEQGCRGRVERFLCADVVVEQVDGARRLRCELAEPVCGEWMCGVLGATDCGG